MKKNSIADMAKTASTYKRGAAAVKKAGGPDAMRKLIKKKAPKAK